MIPQLRRLQRLLLEMLIQVLAKERAQGCVGVLPLAQVGAEAKREQAGDCGQPTKTPRPEPGNSPRKAGS
jgi:hypothetical protein